MARKQKSRRAVGIHETTPAQPVPTRATGTGVPPGTETEAWRILSARVAWVFWLVRRRKAQPKNEIAERSDWENDAAEWRTLVRSALRKLHAEGIQFSTSPSTAVSPESEEWRQLSARVAWLFWMTERRSRAEANESEEASLWGEEADQYRAFIRMALLALKGEGIQMRRGNG